MSCKSCLFFPGPIMMKLTQSVHSLTLFFLLYLFFFTSFRYHLIAHLEMGSEPWVPERVDMTSAMTRRTYPGPGACKWVLWE